VPEECPLSPPEVFIWKKTLLREKWKKLSLSVLNKWRESFELYMIVEEILKKYVPEGRFLVKIAEIKATCGYDFVGGYVRYTVAVSNEGNIPVTGVTVTIDTPEMFRILWHKPHEHKRKGNIIHIGTVKPGETKSIAAYLEPLVCGKTTIPSYVTYTDPLTKNVRSISLKSRKIEVKCPLFFTVTEANLAKVKNLLETAKNKDDRRYGIPEDIDPNEALKIVKRTIEQFDVKKISENTINEKPLLTEVYYYGITKYLKNPIAIKIVVDGENKALIIEAATAHKEQLIGLLSELGNQLIKTLMEQQIIKKLEDLKPLICPQCGAKWKRLPSPDKPLKCPACSISFTHI